MAHYKGKQLIVFADGVAVAASKSCTIEIDTDYIETSSPDQGTWRNFIAGRKKWSVMTNHLVNAPSTKTGTSLKDMVQKVGKTYTLKFEIDGFENDTFSGTAICTSCKITATLGNLMQGSFSWTGSGPLE